MKSFGVERIPRLVLDTSAYSYMRQGHDRVLDLMAEAENILIPVIVLGELDAAFEMGSRTRENRMVLADFLAESFVSVLPTDRSIALRYGQTFASLRRAGTPIGANDVWIAASALDCSGHLLTFDRDFRHIPSLECTILN